MKKIILAICLAFGLSASAQVVIPMEELLVTEDFDQLIENDMVYVDSKIDMSDDEKETLLVLFRDKYKHLKHDQSYKNIKFVHNFMTARMQAALTPENFAILSSDEQAFMKLTGLIYIN